MIANNSIFERSRTVGRGSCSCWRHRRRPPVEVSLARRLHLDAVLTYARSYGDDLRLDIMLLYIDVQCTEFRQTLRRSKQMPAAKCELNGYVLTPDNV